MRENEYAYLVFICMALCNLHVYCAEVPLRNCSLTISGHQSACKFEDVEQQDQL